jgi:hypothetical protein
VKSCSPEYFRKFKKLSKLHYGPISSEESYYRDQFVTIRYLLEKAENEKFNISIINSNKDDVPLFELADVEGGFGK